MGKSKDEPSSALKIKVGSAKKVKKEENSSDEDFELTLPGTANEPPVEENDSEDPKGSKDKKEVLADSSDEEETQDKKDSGVASEDSKDSPDKKDSSDKNKAKKEVLADSSDEEETQGKSKKE